MRFFFSSLIYLLLFAAVIFAPLLLLLLIILLEFLLACLTVEDIPFLFNNINSIWLHSSKRAHLKRKHCTAPVSISNSSIQQWPYQPLHITFARLLSVWSLSTLRFFYISFTIVIFFVRPFWVRFDGQFEPLFVFVMWVNLAYAFYFILIHFIFFFLARYVLLLVDCSNGNGFVSLGLNLKKHEREDRPIR